MKTLPSIIFTAILSISAPAFAFDDADTCGYMEVEISNNTGHTCTLVRKTISHGNLLPKNRVPSMIWPGQQTEFEMTQTMFGPMVDLEYKCGQGHIRLRANQGACYGYAGYAHAELLAQNGMTAHWDVQDPSRYYNTPGIVQWIFEK